MSSQLNFFAPAVVLMDGGPDRAGNLYVSNGKTTALVFKFSGGLHMGDATARLRAFVGNLEVSALFTRRQLVLEIGRRGVVDNELARLIKRCTIVRVATGVYSKRGDSFRLPSALQIVQTRAGAFNKRILFSASNEQNDQSMTANASAFFSDGCNTSFNSIRGRLHLKFIAPRRIVQTWAAPVQQADLLRRRSTNPMNALKPNPKNLSALLLTWRDAFKPSAFYRIISRLLR